MLHESEDLIGKMSILPNVIYRYNPIPTEIPMMCLVKTEKSTPKFIWNSKGPCIAETILKKKKAGGLSY